MQFSAHFHSFLASLRNSKNIAPAINIILWLVLLITVIAVFIPLSPAMPETALDPSWKLGLNQAVERGLSFGKEIIFTMGPYLSIYTKSYYPATDFMTIVGALFLALSYWACLIFVLNGVQWSWILVICFALAGLVHSPDGLFFSYPLLVGLAVFKILFPEDGKIAENKSASFCVLTLLFAALGLLPLIKCSMLILSAAVVALCSVFFVAKKRWGLAITCVLSPLVSMVIFWMASGQSVMNLPHYLAEMMPIVFGYTDAMSSDGPIIELILYLFASFSLLFVISIQKQMPVMARVFLFSIYFLFLFVSFKSGFIRHNNYHALIAGTSILFAALLLTSIPSVAGSKTFLPVIVIALFTWFYIDGHRGEISTRGVASRLNFIYSSAWNGVKNRIENRNWPKVEFDTTMQNIRKQAAFPVLRGTTDIYSHGQSYLIASGNNWSPRPILQSYSVYTPELSEINRKHLLGSQAPDNIIFKVEPLNKEIPSLEDGASWPVLLTNYRPIQMVKDFLFLKRKGIITDVAWSDLKSEMRVPFGASVLLPNSNHPIFAQIGIEPTILGRIVAAFFKPSQLKITFELKNGAKKQFRIIAGMAKSDFMISPLIENTAEFRMLYSSKNLLNKKLVKSIVIAPYSGKSLLWKDKYTIVFSQIKPGYPEVLHHVNIGT
jgi:hypothetical protein